MDWARPTPYVGDVEGHVWDHEKGKYFRIIPSHLATPSQKKYTIEYVQLQRDADKRRKIEGALSQRREAGRIKQSRLLRGTALAVVDLRRSLGHYTSPTQLCDARVSAHINSLRCTVCPPSTSGFVVLSMVADKKTRSVIAGGRALGMESGISKMTPKAWSSNTVVCTESIIETEHRMTDLNHGVISPSGLPCFIKNLPGNPEAVILRQLQSSHDCTMYNPALRNAPGVMALPTERLLYGLQATAAHHSQARHSTFAYGHKFGFKIFSVTSDWPARKTITSYETPQRVEALDWLSEHVLAIGLSNNRVRLHDTRSNAHADRLICDGSVNFLRCVDENRLVIKGAEQRLGLFDLRYTNLCKFHYEPGDHSKKKIPGSTKYVEDFPLIRYGDVLGTAAYSNGRATGLDLLPRLDILAAADNEGGVLIFRISNGELIRRLTVPEHDVVDRPGALIHCLLFIDDDDDGQYSHDVPDEADAAAPRGVVLLGAKESRLIRWDCKGPSAEEEGVGRRSKLISKPKKSKADSKSRGERKKKGRPPVTS